MQQVELLYERLALGVVAVDGPQNDSLLVPQGDLDNLPEGWIDSPPSATSQLISTLKGLSQVQFFFFFFFFFFSFLDKKNKIIIFYFFFFPLCD
jgi:hypothetical protein